MREMIWLVVLVHLTSISMTGQNIRIDSLQTLIHSSPHDTIIVQALNELSWELHRYDINQCMDYAMQALDKAHSINYPQGESRALNLQAIAYSLQGNDSLALINNLEALEIARSINDKYLISIAVNDLGIIYSEQGNYTKALAYYQESLKLAQEVKDQRGLSFSLLNIGITHAELGNQDIAEDYFLKSSEIGNASGDSMAISMAYSNLGYFYLDDQAFEQALIYFNQAKRIAEKTGDRTTEAHMLSSIGKVQKEQKYLEAAQQSHLAALALFKEIGDRSQLPYTYLSLTEVLASQGKIREALEYGEMGLAMSEEMKLADLDIAYYKTLAELQAQNKEYQKAFQYQKIVQIKEDSLFLVEQNNQILEMEAKFQSEAKEVENQLLKEQQAKNEAVIRQRTVTNRAIIIGLLFVSAFAITLFFAYRNKKSYNNTLEEEVLLRTSALAETNQKLLESNRELERFAYIASHDLKEPLRNIVSFTSLIERRIGDQGGEDINEYLGFVVNNAKQMHLLIEDVLEFSRLEEEALSYEEVDVNQLVRKLQETLHTTLLERNAILYTEELPIVYTDATQLFIILKNLVENGIKYNKSGVPTIFISCQKEEDKYYFRVKDNGIGIDPSYHDQVFSMFKRLHHRGEYQGSGLGLSICKKIIQSMGGEISIERKTSRNLKPENSGTTFIFSIPEASVHSQQNDYKVAPLTN